MSKERKGILLHLPQDIFEIMKEYKKISGISYTNMLYNSLVWWLVGKKLLNLDYIKKNTKKEKPKIKEVIVDAPPNEIMFCSSDGCEIDPKKLNSK